MHFFTYCHREGTKAAKLVTATPKETVDTCMNKMLQKDIRHLPLVEEDGKVIGMLSVKDLVQELLAEKEKTIQTLSGTFGIWSWLYCSGALLLVVMIPFLC